MANTVGIVRAVRAICSSPAKTYYADQRMRFPQQKRYRLACRTPRPPLKWHHTRRESACAQPRSSIVPQREPFAIALDWSGLGTLPPAPGPRRFFRLQGCTAAITSLETQPSAESRRVSVARAASRALRVKRDLNFYTFARDCFMTF